MARRRGGIMRIMAVPAFRNRSVNPYNALLYSAVGRVGVTVDEVSPWKLLRARPDVLHIHWPEYFFNARGLGPALLTSLALVLLISGVRVRKTKIVWTIHNLTAHEERHTRLEKRMWRWFVRHVDGYIALTTGGQVAALERFPALESRPGFVIPHGHYRGAYPDEVTREDARRELALPPDARVVTFFGAIRPYKNVPELVDAFRLVAGAGWRLVIAGKPSTGALRRRIVERAARDGRIHLDLRFVPKERVQLYMRAADLFVFPYREVLNSGSALLALSFGRPVLVAERGAMAELRETVGAEWVRTYQGALSAPILVDAMTWAERTTRDAGRLLSDLDWETIARQTVLAYEMVRRLPDNEPAIQFGADA